MWIVTALLIVAAWTALGFVAALLFVRLGFGFETRRRDAELVPQPERQAHMAIDPRYVLTPTDPEPRRRFGDAPLRGQVAGRPRERARPLRATS